MKPLKEAKAEVLDSMPILPSESVPLSQAHGLVLAEQVFSPHDVPSFPNSAMDGYAVRRQDVEMVPVTLDVIEDVPAGSVPQKNLETETAIKIMTGAPIPVGADMVIRVEDTTPMGEKVRIITAAPSLNIRPVGSDVKKGDLILSPGIRLNPVHLGLLAAVGVFRPAVCRRPRVALLSTGDEVQPPDTTELEPGMIRDANRPLLNGLLAELGVTILDLGIVGDDTAALTEALTEGSSKSDFVVSSGGVSMGEYDLVKAVLAEMGSVELWQVAMKPAKPFAFGTIASIPYFGLPGNPVSSLVAFEQFVRPALLTAMGANSVHRPQLMGVAADRLVTDIEKTVFVRVTLSWENQQLAVRSAGAQGSHVLSAAAEADAFAIIPVGQSTVEIGEPVRLEMFRWDSIQHGLEVG